MKIQKFENNKLYAQWALKIRDFGSRTMLLLVLALLVFPNTAMAQLWCETQPATTDPTNLQSSNRLMDAVIVGVAIMIVLFTLVMSIKYLFKPGENSPEHIKNIVKDEGF